MTTTAQQKPGESVVKSGRNHQEQAVTIRPALANDATRVYELIKDNVKTGHLLARAMEEGTLHVPRFFVATKNNKVIGCAELTRLSKTVAEVRSLVVDTEHRNIGIGSHLLSALVTQAVSLRVPRVCAFTHQARPFIHAGFSVVPHPWVPEKIISDCQECDLFRRCHQFAVVLDLKQLSGGTA